MRKTKKSRMINHVIHPLGVIHKPLPPAVLDPNAEEEDCDECSNCDLVYLPCCAAVVVSRVGGVVGPSASSDSTFPLNSLDSLAKYLGYIVFVSS
jgi:hypothetical protein